MKRIQSTIKRVSEKDTQLGINLRLNRKSMGFSQKKLAHKLNISFQQIQKYESGVNRLSVVRLIEISQALSVPLYSIIGDLSDTAFDVKDIETRYFLRIYHKISPHARRLLREFLEDIS
ncbi:MAG: helix-turn-helix domain-containing protein [Alphaproteobacteria bacterium]